MSIKTWPADDRPREKLLRQGVGALSDAELLAVFLRVGVRGQSAVDLARSLLARFGSLHGIFSADLKAFEAVPGMGLAKFAQLRAIQEMARRSLAEELRQKEILTTPQAVRDFLRLSLQNRDMEVFMGVFLNARHQVIAEEILSTGTLTQTSVFPREIVKRALTLNAAAVIFAHNHPSGTTQPSQADRHLTRALVDALATIDVRVLDHFVVAPGGILSFAEQGLMPLSVR